LRDVHGFRSGRFGLDAEQAREGFPEDQVQLTGIEAAYLTILPISILLPISETSDPG